MRGLGWGRRGRGRAHLERLLSLQWLKSNGIWIVSELHYRVTVSS
mgnify:CR=1 FL=1